MPFPELIVRDVRPPAAGLSPRADVALFVGLVRRRAAPLPAAVRAALTEAGWAGSGPFARGPAAVEALLDVPVAVEGRGAFDALFEMDRPLAAGDLRRVPCPLALAVCSFFEAGGVRAMIVRTGDPLPLLPSGDAAAVAQAKRRLLSWVAAAPPADAAQRVPLLPGFGGLGIPASANDPATWHGVAHAWGVEEAAMLLLPDLPELCAGLPAALPQPAGPPPAPEAWRPCASPVPGVERAARAAAPARAAPRLDRAGYVGWSAALRHVLDLLGNRRGAADRRDVMLLASLPLPAAQPDLPAGGEAWPLAILDEAGLAGPGLRLRDGAALGSARLHLGYPWVATAASAAMPEGVEGPEGALAGVLARSALRAGAFRAAAGSLVPGIRGTLPALGSGALRRGVPGAADWLGDRLCLVGARHDGFALLSDATMAEDRAWRAGGVSRLMAILLRAARSLGQERVFDNSGPALWSAFAEDLTGFLRRLHAAGAFAGATEAEAFTVRCDRSTMAQADIDAARCIATVAFTVAQPLQRITVTLALGAGVPAATAEAA
jgi:hypothetical protein